VAWLAVLGIVGGIAATAGGTFSTAMTIDGTDAQRTIDLLQSEFTDASRGAGQVVFHKSDGAPFTESEKEAISRALATVHRLPAVDDTVDPFEVQQTLDDNATDVANAPTEFADGQRKIDRGQEKITDGLAQIADARKDLADGWVEIASNQKKLDEGFAELRAAAKQDVIPCDCASCAAKE
jgi:RND superfamily putative drug exporter